MRRLKYGIALLFALFLIFGFALTAFAQNPHFVSASASISGANLNVSFKESGLGDNVSITYNATADATATYVCVNGGGANPSASNKTTVSGPVSATGTFSSGKNGSISQTLTLSPPPSNITCPKGQKLEVASASYMNVAITDTTTPVGPVSIPGTFSTGCLLPNVRGACS
jgi:hypothetical protein